MSIKITGFPPIYDYNHNRFMVAQVHTTRATSPVALGENPMGEGPMGEGRSAWSDYGLGEEPEYLVVFCHQKVVWWLRWLRFNYRHCFLLALYPRFLLVFDPLSPRWLLRPLPFPGRRRLEESLKDAGLSFVSARAAPPTKPMRPSFISCVAVVKRVLGIRGLLPLTPYGLYRFLRRKKPFAIS